MRRDYLRFTILLTCALGGLANTLAQARLRLERVDDPGKHRNLRLGQYYTIWTADTSYFHSIVGYNDSILFTEREVLDGRDTIRYAPDRISIVPRYRTEQVELRLDHVLVMEMPARTGRTSVTEPFAYVGLLGALAVVVTLPIAVIADGGAYIDDWAIGTGATAALLAATMIADRAIERTERRKRWRLVPRR